MAHELVRHHLRHAICLMLHQHRRAMKVSDIVALLELAGTSCEAVPPRRCRTRCALRCVPVAS